MRDAQQKPRDTVAYNCCIEKGCGIWHTYSNSLHTRWRARRRVRRRAPLRKALIRRPTRSTGCSELVQDRRLARCVQPDHQDAHLLLDLLAYYKSPSSALEMASPILPRRAERCRLHAPSLERWMWFCTGPASVVERCVTRWVPAARVRDLRVRQNVGCRSSLISADRSIV